MILKNEREQIAAYGRKMIDNGLVKGTGGNLSIINRGEGLVAISPAGMDYFDIDPEDVVIVNLSGGIIDSGNKPSSEIDMHLMLYEKRDDISSVIHTHSICTSSISCLRIGIPPVHYLIGFAGKDVRCAEYATYGTKQLAVNACMAMEGRKAALLSNHGLVAGADTLKQAFDIAEIVEYCAEIYIKIRSIGDPVLIGEEEMKTVIEKFKNY
jgi:L-fuculose-phosphate aldolase